MLCYSRYFLYLSKVKPVAIDRDAVAHHEAGHAVAAYVLGLTVDRVTIQPEGDAAGHVVHEYGCNMNEIIYEEDPDRQWALERAAIISLAGEIAQRRFRAESVEEWHGGADRLHVHHLLDNLAGETDQELRDAWWHLLVLRAERLVAQHWLAIEWLAAVLLKQTVIEGVEEIEHTIADAQLPLKHRGKRLSGSERIKFAVVNPVGRP